jgi:hypothetical protein
MDQVKSKLPKNVTYTVFSNNGNLSMEESRIASRLKRLAMLKENPDGMWFDSDMMLLKWFDFDFEPGYVYVSGDGCSASAVYVNGCVDIIDFMIKSYKKSCIHVIIDENRKLFKTIPSGYLLHLNIFRLICAGGGKNKNCEIEKIGDDFKFKTINGVIYG